MSLQEFFTDEGCFIMELYNKERDPLLSVSQARVEPRVTTALHTLDVDERYAILRGSGLMTVGAQKPFTVSPGDSVWIPAGTAQRIQNTEREADLVFLCICSPRFVPAGYREIEPYVGRE